jgi:hypothetical protein
VCGHVPACAHAEVGAVTGLSRPTVEDVVEDFVPDRIVCEVPPEVRVSALGDEAVATGTIRLALVGATEDLFPGGLPVGSLPPR